MKRISSVSRRVFLGGAGAVVALPFLESALPKTARAAEGPLRMLCYYVPCGIHMDAWTPDATGASFQLKPIMASLAAFKDKLLVLSGIHNLPGESDGPGDHASGTGSFLTAAHCYKTDGADISNGISVDQVAANAIGDATTIPSLQLGIDGGSSAGGCDSGYSCAYSRNISWASETQPLPKTTNPAVVFDQLFAGFDPEATAAEAAARLALHGSILDYVLADSKSLALQLGTTDRRKLDEYMTGVYELEKKLQKELTGPICEIPGAPSEDLGVQEHVKVMSDLMALAFQCDSTRIISFMLGNAGSGRAYPFIGVNEGHHETSHHQGLQSNFDKLVKIDTWEVQQLAYLLGKLDAIEEGTGTILDNTVIFFSSEIEDGNSHAHKNLPVLLAGGCGGAFQMGRHIQYSGEKMGNLFVSMLNAIGVPTTSFGDDGTNPLPQLA
jgi:hypothetical protein